jgi:hypothetical protein
MHRVIVVTACQCEIVVCRFAAFFMCDSVSKSRIIRDFWRRNFMHFNSSVIDEMPASRSVIYECSVSGSPSACILAEYSDEFALLHEVLAWFESRS